MKKKVAYYSKCLFLILVALALTGCNKEEEIAKSHPSVVVAKVRSHEIKESSTIVGEVVAKDKVHLRARVTGFLEKRNFKEGGNIKKGDLLFQIEKTEYQAEVESARAQLETAEATLKNTIIDFDRQKYLVDKDAVAKKNYDIAECDKAKAEADILAAKARLKEARLRLSYTDITAPFNGKIGKSRYSVGSLVGIVSDPLALLTMVDPITVEFNVSESLMVTLIQYAKKKGDKKKSTFGMDYVTVKLILANDTKYPVQGKVDFIDNVVNPMTGTMMVRAEFKNSDSMLTPGAYVNVILESTYENKRLLIPQASIQEDQAGKFVMMLDKKNEVEKKSIKTGSVYGIEIVVLEGLKLGDRVIKAGLQKVRPGMIVKPTEDDVIQTHSASVDSKELKDSSEKIDKKSTEDKISKKAETEKHNKEDDIAKSKKD